MLHHVAFSGNIEALNAMSELPYFKDILDDAENEVRKDNVMYMHYSKDGHLCSGLPQKSI